MKSKIFVLMGLLLGLVLLPALASANFENASKKETLNGFVYSTYDGKKLGVIILQVDSYEDKKLFSFNYKGYKNVITLTDTKTINDAGVTVFNTENSTTNNKLLDIVDLVYFENGYSGQFMLGDENLAFYAGKEAKDAEQFLEEFVKPDFIKEEDSTEISVMSHSGRLRGTADNGAARLQAIGLTGVSHTAPNTIRYRLQTKGVADTASSFRRITQTVINPQANNSRLQFGGNQYPTNSSSSVSLGITYSAFSITLNYPVSSITYTDSATSPKFTQRSSGGWQGSVLNYTGSDNSSRGHGARIDLQATSAVRGTTQTTYMYGEYTVRTSFEGGSYYNTYTVGGNYHIDYSN